ncbi:MAG: hypothetical protein WCC48_18680 [Anaeromyxobacteraceae bacterium]
MSYGVHIEREASPIRQEEWLAVLERDSEMRLEGTFDRTNPRTGEAIHMDAPGLAVWLSHPAGVRVLLDLRRGRISAGNPDKHTLAEMRELARQLGAHVRGDEGEGYE